MAILDRLGPYEILGEAGKGGMATVYHARQTSIERDVAIKVILKGISGDADAVQRFQREARLIARLEHPHILPVYDFDGAHDPPYIVMRYLDGGSLKDVIRQGLLPLDEVAHLMWQVCSALDYAHRQGITHRDVKPSNILIDREGNAFVTDFGIAHIAAGDSKKRITGTGMIVGTPDYMSPEQAQGAGDVDHRTDIYALGVMLFEMLTGSLPFTADSPLQLLMKHVNIPAPSILSIQPALPARLDEVLQKAMAKDRAARFDSAIDLSTAITAALGGSVAKTPHRLREAAGTVIVQRIGLEAATVVDDKTAATPQNKNVVALNIGAAAYSELLAEAVGAEAAQRALNRFWSAAEGVIAGRGGVIFVRTDNEMLALWGSASAREDDSEQAIHAALNLQAKLHEFGASWLEDGEPLPLNIGIHRGLALLTPGDKTTPSSASGVAISLTNRLMQNAEGVILITHDVFRQVIGVFDMLPDEPLKVRGRNEKVATYQVERAKPRTFRVMMRGVEGVETRIIGRDAEFRHLQKAFLVAVEDSETQVVTVVGDAGVGKSRLLYEFDKWSDLRPERYFIFSGRATPAMTQRPYALIRDLLAFRFEVQDDDAPAVALSKFEAGITELMDRSDETAHLLAYLSGIDVSSSMYLKDILSDAQEIGRRARQAFVQLINIVAKREPVVLELEDIHYADDASLDLLNDVFVAGEARHLLALCSARASLYDRRPTWGSGQRFHSRIDLKPLDKRDSRDLLLDILQNVPDVPKDLRDKLVDRAEGNPLYLEELVKMLLDERVILKESDTVWRIEASRLDIISVPSTLAGLMEARFDTLLYPEKITLQRASVIGRVFYDTALLVIDRSDETHISDLPAILAKLVEREFIYLRETSAFTGSREYIFASAMLRDMLYDRLLERQRQTYHTGAAAWLTALERPDAYLPLIAEHYEKAGDSAQAAAFLKQSGDVAARRGVYREAIGFLQRVLALLPDAEPSVKLPLLLSLAQALNAQGEVEPTRAYLAEALALARANGDAESLAKVLYQLSLTETNYGNYEAARAYLDEALPLAQASPNQKLLADVLYGLANVGFRTGNYEDAQPAARKCVALAQVIGDDVLHAYALNRLASSLNFATDASLVPEAEGYFREGLEVAKRIGHRDAEQVILNNLGWLAAHQTNWSEAISYTNEALALARELDSALGIVVGGNNMAEFYLSANMPEKAPYYLWQALKAALQIASLRWTISSIDTIGRWKLFQGEMNLSLKLLGLCYYHPASGGDAKEDLTQWLEGVRDRIPLNDAELKAAMLAGKDLDVDATVDSLLEELAQYSA